MSEQRTSSANSSTPGTPTAPPVVTMANIRSPAPLSQIPQVQVIPQPMHSPPYLSSFPYNQQIMLQNAAVAMAQQQLSMAAAMQQGRPPSVSPTSPGLMSPTSSQPGMIVSTTVTPTQGSISNANKASSNGNKAQLQQGPPTQGQATALVGGKPAVMPTQTAQPLVLGQIGAVFSGQGAANPNFIAQSKGQAVSLAHQAQPQLITSQAPLRLSQPQLVTNTGQIITSQPMLTNQAVLQAMASLQQGIPLAAHQPLLNHGQSPAILAGQSLYIRTANPIQAQQGMMANMQALAAGSMKGKMEMPQNLQVPPKPSSGTSKSSSQTGKTLLPSKSTTAKIHPVTGQAAKLNIPTVIPKQSSKGRTKSQSKVASSSVPTTPTSTTAKTAPVSHSKPATPTHQQSLAVQPAVKSQSDSEVETAKKLSPPPEISSTKEKSKSLTAEPCDSPEEKDKEDMADNDKPPVITKEVETPMEVTIDKPPPPLEPVTTVVEKQKAIVKPHILTHIIEGFVIQEGPEPFPVQRSSLLTEFIPPKPSRTDKDSDEEMSESLIDLPPPLLEPEAGFPTRNIGADNSSSLSPSMLKCEYCGKTGTAVRFRRSKRFCSRACAKRYNVACSRRMGLFKTKTGSVKLVKKRKHPLAVRKGWRPGRGGRLAYNINMQQPGGEEASSSNSGQEETSSSPTSPAPTPDMDVDALSPASTPAKWTVMEVYEFIKSLPGCATYADEFLSQEIDGQALLLLKEDHLMTAMNIKLGPALKICARITSLKDEYV